MIESQKFRLILVVLFLFPVSHKVLSQSESETRAQADEQNSVQDVDIIQSNSFRIEEVLVTAQRRIENMQDVPVAITNVSAQSLALAGAVGVETLQVSVPGLMFTQGAGAYSLPRIRGVGTGSVGPGVENSIGIYVDGVYTVTTAGMLKFNNIEQIAVLKGPQGTLFGRNSTGGVIQVSTLDPGSEVALDADLTIGDYQTIGANIYASAPLRQDIATDIAVYYNNRLDGFGQNKNTGDDVGDGYELAVRTKTKWDISDQTTLRLVLDYSKTDIDQPILRLAEGTQTIFGGGLAGKGWDVNTTLDPTMSNTVSGASIRVDHVLGALDFASITAYRSSDLTVGFDADSLPAFITDVLISQDDNQFTQEFQLLSPDEGALTWVLGIYYLDAEGEYDPQRILVGAPPYTRIRTLARQSTESLAGFGQATLAMTADTNLTVGLRHTSEKREILTDRTITLPNGFTLPQQIGTGDATFDESTWRFSIDHRLTDDILGYISYNRGFKSGLFDPLALPPSSVQPEILDAYEIGMKAELFDQRLRINAAAFHYDYENIQVIRIVDGAATILNGAKASIDGIDLDVAALLTSRLSLSAGLSVLDSQFDEFPDAIVTTPLPNGGNVVTSGSAKGNKLPMTPDWTANLTVTYEIPSHIGNFILSGTYYYNDGYFEGPENRLAQKSYGLLNTFIGWRSTNDKLSASLWGRNLTDEFYGVQLTAQAQRDALVPGDPRTFGITLGYRF